MIFNIYIYLYIYIMVVLVIHVVFYIYITISNIYIFLVVVVVSLPLSSVILTYFSSKLILQYNIYTRIYPPTLPTYSYYFFFYRHDFTNSVTISGLFVPNIFIINSSARSSTKI